MSAEGVVLTVWAVALLLAVPVGAVAALAWVRRLVRHGLLSPREQSVRELGVQVAFFALFALTSVCELALGLIGGGS